MRLLWEEEGFELVGAFCVAGFSLGAAWIAVEALFELSGFATALLAIAATVCVLETVSRRHYADRRPVLRPESSGPRVEPERPVEPERRVQPERRERRSATTRRAA